MSRDQRAHENWALLYASALATQKGLPLRVVFCLVPKFLDAPIRHFGFMLRGMAEVEAELREKNVPFHLLRGWAPEVLPGFAQEAGAAAVVTDMSPLRHWAPSPCGTLDPTRLPVKLLRGSGNPGAGAPRVFSATRYNIVPVWVASPKQEYAARTIRSKIHGVLPEFLVPVPELPPTHWAAPRARRPGLGRGHRLPGRRPRSARGHLAAAGGGRGAGHPGGLLRRRPAQGLRGPAQERPTPRRPEQPVPLLPLRPAERPGRDPGGEEALLPPQRRGGRLRGGGGGTPGTLGQLLLLPRALRQPGGLLRLGARVARAARRGPSGAPLRPGRAGGGAHPRRSVERRAGAYGDGGEDARLPAHVLGQEDPRVDTGPRHGAPARELPQRPLLAGRPGPQRLRGHRLVDHGYS
ncbi:unnamed protein product [Heterosigma akashiwo]